MAELPNPASFEAATASVTPDQVAAQFACGPDPERHLGWRSGSPTRASIIWSP
jgi:hypothetical protein